MKEKEIKNVLNTYEEYLKLKRLKRKGWNDWNIKSEPESVADHIFGCQILAWCIMQEAKLDIDIKKVIAMLSLHETEEIIIGDLTPVDKVSKQEKKERGKEAVKQVLANLNNNLEMHNLIEEFEEGKTEEAKFAKLCDKLECDLQARFYQKQGYLKWNNAPKKLLQDERVKRIRKEGAKEIDQVFLANDYPYFKDTVFEEIANYLKKENQKKNEKKRVAIVLEGGALRGIYSSGVLDAFLEKKIEVDCLVGVSAGALNGMNYISKQKGRSAKINLDYCDDPQYIGRKAIARSKGIIGFDYLFEEISKEKLPFDEKKFVNSKIRFVATATNCSTGEAEYFEKDEENIQDFYKMVQASSSMPLASSMVPIRNSYYLDGAVADSVPVKWALAEGYDKVIVILTRDKEFRKKKVSNNEKKLYQVAYKKYPNLLKKLYTMPERYNKLREEMDDLEKNGNIYIIRPQKEVTVARLEKDKEKLKALYEDGYNQTLELMPKIEKYIKGE